MSVTAAPGTWLSERRRSMGVAAVLVAALAALGAYLWLADNALEPVAASEPTPAVVEHVEGSDVARLTLEANAITRLDLRTAATRRARVDGRRRIAVPYAAVVYDAAGGAWVYTNPKPRTFTRQSITIERVEGSRAILSAGPAVGTQLVTTGAQELWGAELGIDGESH